MKKLLIMVAVGATVVLGLGAGSASAGEITGNGKALTVKANSICAYSGLNDEITEEEPGKVQNWGSVPKETRDFLASIGVSPKVECNAHNHPYKK